MKILMICSTFPYPPSKGAIQLRTFNLLKYLSQNHTITLITQQSEEVTEAEVEKLRELLEELVIFPQSQIPEVEEGIREKVKRFRKFLQEGTPRQVLQLYSPEIQQWVDEAVESGKFEVITCEHSLNEIYIRSAWQQSVRLVVNIHNSVYRSARNQLETKTTENQLKEQLNLPLLRRYEERYCSKFSAIVVTNSEDRRQIAALEPEGEIVVIPNGVDITQFPRRISDPGGHKLVLVGAMDNRSNIDAVRFFCLEVFPGILQRYPDAKMEILEPKPVESVLELGEHQGIKVVDSVSSTVEYLHKATICVVPMQTGFGIKNKTLEAMATGVPVVGSDIGLEGLVVDGGDVPLRALRANESAEYVYAISRLFENRQLRKQLSENGKALVREKHGWQRAGELYEQIISGGYARKQEAQSKRQKNGKADDGTSK
ncbi:MAG: glycosyltransferase [Symploca sp. SIO2G7]|nr:glycosyltransferase [Symploca sp. SIO2G7]